MDTTTLTSENFSELITLSDQHDFGEGATGFWSENNTVFTIILGVNPTVSIRDIVFTSNAILDAGGRVLSTATRFVEGLF